MSIILLNHNYGSFLREAIESVFAQTFADWELVIADDGSTDGSLVVALPYEGDRCRVLRGDHVGLELNLERGLAECRGDLVAITSADDRWLAQHLEIGVAALDADTRAGLSYSLMRSIDEAGRVIELPDTLRRPEFRSGWISPFDLLPGQFIPTQTTLFRREAIERVGGVDRSLHLLELDLILRIVENYPVAFTGQTTGEYRLHGGSLSSDPGRMLEARLALYDKHLANASPKLRRRYEAGAYAKTAYRELVRSPTRRSTTSARRHILRAIKRDPRAAITPLHAAMLVASYCGPFYPILFRATSRVVSQGRIKGIVQRALGLAGASHHSFGAIGSECARPRAHATERSKRKCAA